MFTLALRGVISGSPSSLPGTVPPRATLAGVMPWRFPLWQGGLAAAPLVPCPAAPTLLPVPPPGAAAGDGPQAEQEPWARQGLALVRHPTRESAGVNPTPPSLAFSLCPSLSLRVGAAGWCLRQPAERSAAAPQPTPAPGLGGMAAMASLVSTAAGQPAVDHVCDHSHC